MSFAVSFPTSLHHCILLSQEPRSKVSQHKTAAPPGSASRTGDKGLELSGWGFRSSSFCSVEQRERGASEPPGGHYTCPLPRRQTLEHQQTWMGLRCASVGQRDRYITCTIRRGETVPKRAMQQGRPRSGTFGCSLGGRVRGRILSAPESTGQGTVVPTERSPLPL